MLHARWSMQLAGVWNLLIPHRVHGTVHGRFVLHCITHVMILIMTNVVPLAPSLMHCDATDTALWCMDGLQTALTTLSSLR